ncbi:MAG: hypothetical protein GJ680_01395 [Alteromonadaceae bacterium]|nr:hypothetical protein [Alteromonadaceae bacterium]
MTRYSLNDVIFDSELNTLSIGEQSVDLDPKLAELLLMLIANQGRVLSRDELLEQVWGKSIVSDNTINWSISQLRKALNDNAKEPLFIKTLPKKGYQFVAHVHTLDDSKSSIHDDSVIPKNRTLGTIFLAVAAASLSILLLFWFTWEKQAQDQGIDITSTYPLTSLPGHERSGGLSQDGLYLAFLHRPLDSTSFDVLLKPLRENKKLPVADASSQNEQLRDSRRTLSPYAINNDDYDYRFVIWGSDGYELLAVRGRNNSCEIVSLALTLDRKEVSQVRVLSDCTNTAATWLALDRDKTELFVVGDLVQSGRRDLYRLNLESGEVSSVLKSSTDGAGFRFVDVHRQTGELLLLEDLYYRETNFLAYHPKSNKKVLLQHIDSVYYTAYWSVEPNKVWHNWGNDKVVEFDVETKQLSLLLETTVGWNYDFRPVANDLAIYLVSDADSSNLQFFASNSTPKLTPTSYSESEPVYSPKGGKLAYVSNRSGIPQIWLKIGEEHSQLTDTQNFQ